MKRQIFIKKPFARMQKFTLATLCIVYTLLSWSCQNKNEVDLLSDEQISFNLSQNGKTDPELLIGEWDAVKFAYTADGHRISDVVKISSAQLEIPVAPTYFECDVYNPENGVYTASETWKLYVINGSAWVCSLSGNSIKVSFCGQTKRGVPCPHEEWDIFRAFYNAYSFVIKGNELIIFFIEDVDGFFGDVSKPCSIVGGKKMNLIIFKK